MINSNISFIRSTLAYVFIIGGVLLWSGQNKEKSLYDRHLITLHSISLKSSDLKAAKALYVDLLEFHLESESDKQLEMRLPDNRFLSLTKADSALQSHANFSIRVRNGISKLRDELSRRIDALEKSNSPYLSITISNVYSSEKGKEFVVQDSDKNTLTFFQRSLLTRK